MTKMFIHFFSPMLDQLSFSYFIYLFRTSKKKYLLRAAGPAGEEETFLSLKYKKYLILPIKYSKHYKSTEYMKSTILSINMIGNEKQKTWQKNTIFKCKMLKGACPC